MKVVVKIGGAALANKSTLAQCAESIVALMKGGDRVAVVHGGGAALTQTLDRLGKQSAFVGGLRVTDAETRDVALMVLAGLVNKRLVAALTGAGASAVGLCGGDGSSFRARKKQTDGGDLGFVGEISSVDPRWLEAIWSQGALPVISSIALSDDGDYYNVNADEMASACAAALNVDALIFLTDVPGVKGEDGSVISYLKTSAIPQLIASSVIVGGMLPKLDACRTALARGVARVRILPAADAHMLPALYSSRLQPGTEVLA
jgi:acetylglutamate kinase